MTPDKQRRVATAVGFLSGVFACLTPLRDKKILWPPDVVWQSLTQPERLAFIGGVALIVVTFVLSLTSNRATRRP